MFPLVEILMHCSLRSILQILTNSIQELNEKNHQLRAGEEAALKDPLPFSVTIFRSADLTATLGHLPYRAGAREAARKEARRPREAWARAYDRAFRRRQHAQRLGPPRRARDVPGPGCESVTLALSPLFYVCTAIRRIMAIKIIYNNAETRRWLHLFSFV